MSIIRTNYGWSMKKEEEEEEGMLDMEGWVAAHFVNIERLLTKNF